jgi:transposase
MLDSMEVTMIRSLAERGVTISAIARQMGIDRKTVRSALKQPEAPAALETAPSVLDPYKDYLRGRLEVADFTAQRLFQDIQAQGYTGGYNLVKRFVAPLRAEHHRQAVIRFETQPGHQAQIDWSAFGLLVVDGVRKALSCFSMILGFSRYQYIEFTLSQNLASFLTCHVHAFEYFGGVPDELLYDNLKTAVLSHVDGTVEWQSTFTDFAAYYGFTPRACRPYRAQTKGKVERPFPYIRSNFFLGRTFTGLDDVNAQGRHWLDHIANARIHGTTHERPLDRFQIERVQLRPLPQQAYRTVETTFRSATRDCVISYGGNFYSVPARHAARRHLRVEVSPANLTIYHNAEKIAVHRLCHGRHHRIIDPKHLEGLVVQAAGVARAGADGRRVHRWAGQNPDPPVALACGPAARNALQGRARDAPAGHGTGHPLSGFRCAHGPEPVPQDAHEDLWRRRARAHRRRTGQPHGAPGTGPGPEP